MKEVLPDTNIILWTFSGGIDFREAIASAAPDFDIKIPTCVIDELKKLDTKKSKAALSFTSNMEKVDIGRGYVDDLLIKSAREGKLIATNDKELLLRLKKEKINALRIREKNKLVMTETE